MNPSILIKKLESIDPKAFAAGFAKSYYFNSGAKSFFEFGHGDLIGFVSQFSKNSQVSGSTGGYSQKKCVNALKYSTGIFGAIVGSGFGGVGAGAGWTIGSELGQIVGEMGCKDDDPKKNDHYNSKDSKDSKDSKVNDDDDDDDDLTEEEKKKKEKSGCEIDPDNEILPFSQISLIISKSIKTSYLTGTGMESFITMNQSGNFEVLNPFGFFSEPNFATKPHFNLGFLKAVPGLAESLAPVFIETDYSSFQKKIEASLDNGKVLKGTSGGIVSGSGKPLKSKDLISFVKMGFDNKTAELINKTIDEYLLKSSSNPLVKRWPRRTEPGA